MVKHCRNREVTLSLVVAAAGFVVPFERLKPDGQYKHPSGDREMYPEIANQLTALLSHKFLGSSLHPELETTWQNYGKLKTIEGDPERWGLKEKSFSKNVSGVVKTIRNAMAHGNLFTRGNPIEEILFVSVNSKPVNAENTIREVVYYSVISVSPEGFLSFLRNWFGFIKQQDVSEFDLWRLVDAA